MNRVEQYRAPLPRAAKERAAIQTAAMLTATADSASSGLAASGASVTSKSAAGSATCVGGGAPCIGRATVVDDDNLGHGPVAPSGDAAHPQQLCVPTDGTSPPSPAAEVDDGSEMCGGGGCIATAIVELRVCKTVKEAKAMLNKAGGRIYTDRRKKRNGRSRAKVYTRGKTWTPQVVQHVVQARRFEMKKIATQNDFLHGNGTAVLTEAISTGVGLLVEGTLAQIYHGPGGELVTQDDDEDGPDKAPKAWCHSIAIRDQVINDSFNVYRGR